MRKVMPRKEESVRKMEGDGLFIPFFALIFLGHDSKSRVLRCPHRAIILSSGTDEGHTTDNLIWDREAFHQWRERES